MIHLFVLLFIPMIQCNDFFVITFNNEGRDIYSSFLDTLSYYHYDSMILPIPEEILNLVNVLEPDDYLNALGGYRLKALRDTLEKYRDNTDRIFLYVNSASALFSASNGSVISQFKKMEPARIVFAAEHTSRLDDAFMFPAVDISEKKYLHESGFVGYADDLYRLLNHRTILDREDEWIFFASIFLDEKARSAYRIVLDKRCSIFQVLEPTLDEVEVIHVEGKSEIRNSRTASRPAVLIGQNSDKLISLSNYVADYWSPKDGCQSCEEGHLELTENMTQSWPRVHVALFVDHLIPFLPEFLESVEALDYPKDKIDLLLYVKESYHFFDAVNFLSRASGAYASVKRLLHADQISPLEARDEALRWGQGGDFLLFLSAEVRLDNSSTLKALVRYNRTCLTPMMVRPGYMWSTFWGAVNEDGFYSRSFDYADIIGGTKVGIFNVPYVSGIILFRSEVLERIIKANVSYRAFPEADKDISFAFQMRQMGIFMHVVNTANWGHLVNPDGYNISYYYPELAEFFNNPLEWEKRYIHPDYATTLESSDLFEPCPDVFWFPIVSDALCKELTETMEHLGAWNDGHSENPTLEGGYENVPARDVHMRQIDLEDHWLAFINSFVRPLQEKAFDGYFSEPEPNSYMMFMIRYRPGEQEFVQPMEDASTYTVNIALNSVGEDFSGGGLRFMRYNCTITSPRKGWMFIHPGRLTHYNEGLHITKGTRYILVHYVDP